MPDNTQFTAAEQVAGYRLLRERDPKLALGDLNDPDVFEAFIDACEDAICEDD